MIQKQEGDFWAKRWQSERTIWHTAPRARQTLKTRRWEVILHESQQPVNQATGADSSAPDNVSSPEARPASEQARVLHIAAPSRRSDAHTRSRRRVIGWRFTALQWIGLSLLALAVVFSLFQVTLLRPGQQGFLFFQTGPGGSYLLPTATPKPKPTLPPGSGQVVSIINSVFGSYATAAIAVARCESGLNPSAVNPTSIGGSHAAGVFQILYPSTWNTTSQAGHSPYDAQANVQAAFEIFKRDGYNWHEWSCKP